MFSIFQELKNQTDLKIWDMSPVIFFSRRQVNQFILLSLLHWARTEYTYLYIISEVNGLLQIYIPQFWYKISHLPNFMQYYEKTWISKWIVWYYFQQCKEYIWYEGRKIKKTIQFIYQIWYSKITTLKTLQTLNSIHYKKKSWQI